MTTDYLPFPELVEAAARTELSFPTGKLSFPAPSASWVGALAGALRESWAHLQALPSLTILRALESANQLWADPASQTRQEADRLLAAVTGYPADVLTPAITHLFTSLRAGRLLDVMAEELIDPEAMDRWVERPDLGTRSRGFGPRLTVIVASGNVPMAAIPSLVFAILAKSPVLVKLSSEEPVLAGLYLRALATVEESLARTFAAVWWPGGDDGVEAAALPQAEAVIAFGGAAALRSLARRLEPGTRLQAHGHRIGFGVVGRERLTRAELPPLTAATARDVVEFDQQGCVAPQRIFVERGGDVEPHRFASELGEALAARTETCPRRRPPPAAAAAIHQLRASAEVRGIFDPEVRVFASPHGTEWTVVYDPEPGFGPGCLHRTVIVHPVDDLAGVPDCVAPHAAALQTVVAALAPERLEGVAESLARVGVTRVCPLGLAQRPAPGWHPDGRPRLADLVRWVDIEEAGFGS